MTGAIVVVVAAPGVPLPSSVMTNELCSVPSVSSVMLLVVCRKPVACGVNTKKYVHESPCASVAPWQFWAALKFDPSTGAPPKPLTTPLPEATRVKVTAIDDDVDPTAVSGNCTRVWLTESSLAAWVTAGAPSNASAVTATAPMA